MNATNELAYYAISSILDGSPPNGTDPAQLGDFAECYGELARAHALGGTDAARSVFVTYAEANPILAALRSANAEPEDDNAALVVSIVGEASNMLPLPACAYIDAALADGASPWLDAYVEHSRKWSPRAYDGFHEATGLWIASTVAARRVKLDLGGEHYTNLFFALASRTSLYAKTTTVKVGMDVLKDAGLMYLLAPDDATPQAFIRTLTARLPADWGDLPREKQLMLMERIAFSGQKGWFYDEFGQKISAMMRDGGYMADFRGLLRKFDDTPSAYEYASVSRGSDTITAPYLALLANLTPADLKPFAKPGSALWGDGFWARFSFIAPPPDYPRRRGRFPEGVRVTPVALVSKLKAWHQRLGVPTPRVTEQLGPDGKTTGKFDLSIDTPSPHRCTLGEGVYEAFYRYDEAMADLIEVSKDQDLDGNYSRLAEKALRVAMILASLENDDHIEIRHWARAQQITESWRQSLHHIYVEVTAPDQSQSEAIESKIMRLLDLKGPLTQRQIYTLIRGLDSSTSGIILHSMVNAGLLEVEQQGKTQRYKLAG